MDSGSWMLFVIFFYSFEQQVKATYVSCIECLHRGFGESTYWFKVFGKNVCSIHMSGVVLSSM